MKSGRKVNGWRSLVGVMGIAALALGLSLKLEGAPAPISPGSTEAKSTRDEVRAVTPTKVESVSVAHAAPAVPAESTSRVKAGSIPDGMPVIATIYVDWRDDEGTRLRNAGKLVGPLPSPGQAGVVAGACDFHGCFGTCPGQCSVNTDCDDVDPCTSDRCDITVGAELCSGICVHDPVGDNGSGGCDDGLFCNGKETCQGAVCEAGSQRNMHCAGGPRKDQACSQSSECPDSSCEVGAASCDSHADCGLPGTCTANVCSVGNVGATCVANADCDIRGTCGGGDNDPPCDSDFDCAPGVCTFRGTCSVGQCTPGIAAICCPDNTDPTRRTVCSEESPRCSSEASNAGVVCKTSSDCKGGVCERCQPSCENDTDCSDGRRCNGAETCERTCVGGTNDGLICVDDSGCPGSPPGTCVGQCLPGVNPCGAGAICQEKRCSVFPPTNYCQVDADCSNIAPPGQTCIDLADPLPLNLACKAGRCCNPAAADASSCTKDRLDVCDNTLGSMWYMDDDGEQVATDPCGGRDTAQTTPDEWGCPKYSSGIGQLVASTPPVYPVKVGPVSDSKACVPLPGGPGGVGGACADPFDPTGRFFQLGDDYHFYNDAPIGLDVVRFVFKVINLSRLSMDIYDDGGNFVEDMNVLFQADLQVQEGIVILILRDPMIIPARGWLVLRTAEFFEPDSKFQWYSTTSDSGIVGDNDPDALWINSYPGTAASVSNNFLKACDAGPRKDQACVDASDCPNGACVAAPGIMAFELVGDKVAEPKGACCTSFDATAAAGDCTDGVFQWVCVGQGNVYHGNGSLCNRCNGGTRTGQDCSTDPVCPPSGICSTGQVGNSCALTPTPDDASCNEAGVCATPNCNNSVDDDSDTKVNDGCPAVGPAETQCDDDLDNDSDGKVNDGCPAVGAAEDQIGFVCVNSHAPPSTPCTVLTQETDCGVVGTCETGGTCSTGNVGTVCPLGDDGFCNEVGVCSAETGFCSNPHAPGCTSNCGQPNCCSQICNVDTDCNIAGTCVAVECKPLAACGSGACCNPITGACSTTIGPTTCTDGGGNWQGYGTDCDSDNGKDVAQQHCCPQPDLGMRCMSGPNNLQTCASNGLDANSDGIGDADCRFCMGGSKNGLPCTTTSDPTTGCLDVGVCDGGTCVGGLPPDPNTCSTNADCPDNSGFCRGRCMVRSTGGDNCNDAAVLVITVPSLNEEPKTITVTGNNNFATTSDDEPENCQFREDPGWWEAFSIDKCARVRLDFCCSDPVREPSWNGIQGACNPDGSCADFIGDEPDEFTPGQQASSRGAPYCLGEDNVWETYGPLEPGTYYKPIFSELIGAHGQYQWHVTVQACGSAACCYLACSIGGQHCDVSAPCLEGDGTCESYCDTMVRADCEAKQGFFLSPPDISPRQAQCFASTCDSGSCCTGPGICKDSRENFGDPVTKALCESPEFGAGIFVGGVDCKGGTCAAGTFQGLSCRTSADCDGQTCNGTAAQLLQELPCPVCTIEGSNNCQAFDFSNDRSASDLGTGSGAVTADDFVLPSNGTLTSVCVWGSYVETDLDTAALDCGGPEDPGSQRPDTFRVRVYEDDGGKPGGGNCSNQPLTRCFVNSECPPGGTCVPKPFGESLASRAKSVVDINTGGGWTGNTWEYQLTLDTPIADLRAGECYWLEVVNNTGPEYGNKCTWFWSNLTKGSTEGNKYSASGSDVNGYDVGSARNWDMAWCTNLDTIAGGCASHNTTQACCSCPGVCSPQTLSDCDDASSVWHYGEVCPTDCDSPPNDFCVAAEEVPVGLYSVSTQCAGTDGPNPVLGRLNSGMFNDVWYNFRATEDCPLRVDTCSGGQISFFDSAIAIYHNSADPSHCPCPANSDQGDAMLKDASDDDCIVLGSANGGIAETNAVAGGCYTIRIGGFPGTDQGGRVGVDISCGLPVCGDGRRNGQEECDGEDQINCLTATPTSTLCKADCTCGDPNPCGDGDLDTGEECDPGTPGVLCNAPSVCRQAGDPKQCTCTPVCGNGGLEEREECDGDAPLVDHPCPGRCRSTEDPPVCLCPSVGCQNGRLEELASEECEFGLCTTANAARKCSDKQCSGMPANTSCTGTGQGSCPSGQTCDYVSCVDDTACGAGKCLDINECSDDLQCETGICNLDADRLDCESGGCRTKNDPLGGCKCGCPSAVVLNNIVWDPATNPTPWPNSNPEATTRALRFRVVETEPGPSKVEAIKITMVDLMHPDPRNLIQNPPPNYSTFDTGTASRCSGATTIPNRNGHHCANTSPDCLGGDPNGAVTTDDGTCSPTAACTAAGGCEVWVGQPWTFYEAQGPPQAGPYRASRLQCMPKYWDWKAEAGGLVTVIGAEILPSSEYSVQLYASTCMGAETGCTDVSTPVTMYTRRKGDVDTPYQSPAPAALNQADVLDISQAVASVKHVGPAHYRGQMQPNLPELNSDASVLDIVEAVDSVKRLAYSFSGPCDCTLAPACGGSCAGCVGLCLKKCVGGDNDGQTCINERHCPGVCSGGSNPGATCPTGIPGGVNCVGTCVGGGNPGAACTNPGTQCTGGGVCSGQCSGACGATGTCFDKCGRCQ